MRNRIILAALGVAAAAANVRAQAPAAAPAHTVFDANALTWTDGPPALPKGGQMAVLSGDPRQAGPFTLRSKLPAGYTIPPHWHPTAEHLTILSGEVSVGMGETFDTKSMRTMGPGAFAVMAPEMRHYLKTKTETVLQVHGTGPFQITYVNPADDPRGAPAAK
jgi:hypothetical protein